MENTTVTINGVKIPCTDKQVASIILSEQVFHVHLMSIAALRQLLVGILDMSEECEIKNPHLKRSINTLLTATSTCRRRTDNECEPYRKLLVEGVIEICLRGTGMGRLHGFSIITFRQNDHYHTTSRINYNPEIAPMRECKK